MELPAPEMAPTMEATPLPASKPAGPSRSEFLKQLESGAKQVIPAPEIVPSIEVMPTLAKTTGLSRSEFLKQLESGAKANKAAVDKASKPAGPTRSEFLKSLEKKSVKTAHPVKDTHSPKSRSIEYKRQPKSPGRKVAGVIGAMALVPTLITSAALASALFEKGKKPATTLTAEPLKPQVTETTTSTVVVTTPSTEAPAPVPVTEAPKAPFRAKPGDWIATVEVGALCTKWLMVEFDEQEVLNIDNNNPNDIEIGDGTQRAQLDKLVPAPEPQNDCEPLSSRLAPNAKTRASLVNDNGQANRTVPIVGHGQLPDGNIRSAYPCTSGTEERRVNSVWAGHRMTHSAPMYDTGELEPGDTAVVTRADGVECTYVMIDKEILPANADENLATQYKNPNYASTGVSYGCSDKYGNAGSGSNRYIVHWGLKGSEITVSSTDQVSVN